jgi:NAD(P)-dependent dehydrogenase (short-subunit alcohol dehydrogenase family)
MPTALLTGAASGIGRATATALVDAGWDVYATDVDADGLDDLGPRGCRTARVDVTDRSSIDAVVERITDETGRIDCLINNAGYGQMGPVEDVPIERMQAQFDVNYWGTIRCTKAVLPVMREQGDGTICNVSSVQGRVTSPGWGAYAGSKHALEGTSDALRVEVAEQGVDVVLVEPAWVETGFVGGVAERLTGFDRTDCYERLYDALDGTDVVDGGWLAIPPERVARQLVAIAEADDPDARYAVGLPGKFVVVAGLLPDWFADRVQRWMVDRYAERS